MARVESVQGSYIYLEVQGIEYRVYFEQTGKGIPLVCQHTAGAEGRQWRHLLNDGDIPSRFHVIVPDLPYHGKSLPPETVEWWKEEYRLTKSFLIDFHVAFSHALGLKKPVYLGCSMGGSLAVDLAIECPDEFRAVIGLEAGLSISTSLAKMAPALDWRDHPRIGNRCTATRMFGHTSPFSPEKCRREISWIYYQGAPAIHKGDLGYHFVEHNLTGSEVRQIDTSRIPVYLMTGDYDWGNAPEDTLRLAEHIKGAKFTEMKGLGHFPMSEDFPVFKRYLMPILNEIAET